MMFLRIFRHFSRKSNLIENGPGLKDFMIKQQEVIETNDFVPYLQNMIFKPKKVYIEVFGCQMNVNDTEIVRSILISNNYIMSDQYHEADVILLMTCSIRENAETKIWNRLKMFRSLKQKANLKIGILGCMAERLKHRLLECDKTIDLVAGPDSYKSLPRLLADTENNQQAINVMLSLDETYADITPVRLDQNSATAFISIMRGCDNMCTYCIVPFTRGKERSRPIKSIETEAENLVKNENVKEITLLGQNVNSYRDYSVSNIDSNYAIVDGFKTVYKAKSGGLQFAHLLEHLAKKFPDVRIRFTSPHPKDFPDRVLEVIRDYPNICKNLHLPVQSGNSDVLERMRRGYTRESYLKLVDKVRYLIPNISLSSDFICGFCGETESEFQDTLSLMRSVRYNTAFLFKYSMREKTTAYRRFSDDVPDEVKKERLIQMAEVYRIDVEKLNKLEIGQTHLILIEGRSKRSEDFLYGRNESNCKVIVPKIEGLKVGDFVAAKITDANSQVLKGDILYQTTISDFYTKLDEPKAIL